MGWCIRCALIGACVFMTWDKRRVMARVRQAAEGGEAADPRDLPSLRGGLFPINPYRDGRYVAPLTPEEIKEEQERRAGIARRRAHEISEARVRITPLTAEELEEAKRYVENRDGWCAGRE